VAFIFPTNPNIGDLVTNPSSGQIFRWNGFAWGGDSANALLTASFAFTASYLLGDGGSSVSSSYSETASYAFYAVSASHEITHEISSSYSDTASYVETAQTASYVQTAQTASYFLTSSVTSASYSETANLALNFITSSVTSASLAQTASYALNASSVGFNREIHVSSGSGDDTLGNGSLSRPYKTITKALTVLGNTGEALVVHPGTYRENVTINQLNVSIQSSNIIAGGIVYISGSVTVASATAASSVRLSGFMIKNVVHNNVSPLYMKDTLILESLVKSGNAAYNEYTNCTMQTPGGISVTGTGTVVFQGDKQALITVNNAGAIVVVKDSLNCTGVTVTAGTFAAINSSVYSISSGSAAITSNAGSVVQLYSTNIATTTGLPERINIGGFLGYDDITFNKVSSTLGTQLGVKAHFQSLDANLLTATGSLFGTASLAQTASFVATASYVFNLQQVTTAGNFTSQSISISASLAQGSGSVASGIFSHAEGDSTTAVGVSSHAEGTGTKALGSYSHAEGDRTSAHGAYSHAEGRVSEAIGAYSHAEGDRNTAIGNYSHVEGSISTTTGVYSHAEGSRTIAIGAYSHAEGSLTTAIGEASHAEGFDSVALGDYQTVVGQFNQLITSKSAFIIGDGASEATRHNLLYASGGRVDISGSLIAPTITGSLQGTASNALTASYVETARTASYFLTSSVTNATFAQSASYFSGSNAIVGNLTVRGTASIEYLDVRFESASVIYSSGSNIFGDASNDVQTLNGQVNIYNNATISGSLVVLGGITGSLLGTASYALTASHALMADTASYAIVSIQSITSSVTNDIVFQAKNNGTNIPAGTPVYISSSNGNNIIVERAQALDQTQTFDLKSELAGVTQTAINGGQSGTVVAFGQVSGINLSAYNSGDKIWVSKTIGELTNVAPLAPFDRTFVGIVTKNTNQGELFVNPSQPIHFHDISSVSSSIYNPGDLWVYQASASTGIWTNKKTLSGSYEITGSLNVPSITGSLLGSSSYALSASDAQYSVSASHALIANDLVNIPSLQAVTTAGNFTSQSISITGSLSQGESNTASGNYSHAEGVVTTAIGSYSHAEGGGNVANGLGAHVEGEYCVTNNKYSHAEGSLTQGNGDYSHAEGKGTITNGTYSHAEGETTVANGQSSHAEGVVTTAIGVASHAEGAGTTTNANYSHAEGEYSITNGKYSHAEGRSSVTTGDYSHVEGYLNASNGAYSHAEGVSSQAIGDYSHAEGSNTTAIGGVSHTEGYYTTAAGSYSHAEGLSTMALGEYSHVEGNGTTATANFSHAEGIYSAANGAASHAEGGSSIASGVCSHAEGGSTQATQESCHSEGGYTLASAQFAHAEGYYSQANGPWSHAEGQSAQAIGTGSHAEGLQSVVTGMYSHGEGYLNAVNGENSHAEGMFNLVNGDYAHAEGFSVQVDADYAHGQGHWNIPITEVGAFAHGNGINEFNKRNLVYFGGPGNNVVQITGSMDINGSLFLNGVAVTTGGGGGGSVGTLQEVTTAGNQTSSSLGITGSLLIQSASVDGEVISNIGDTFTSTEKATKIVTCTAAEYAGIATKNPNTFYIVI
jgi:hypothetical protein